MAKKKSAASKRWAKVRKIQKGKKVSVKGYTVKAYTRKARAKKSKN